MKVNADNELNHFKLLENCYWMTVNEEVPEVKNGQKDDLGSRMFQTMKQFEKPKRQAAKPVKKILFRNTENIELPKVNLDEDVIDWRNRNGINYLTYPRNQHIPVYCGSCWAQAGVSIMMDRHYINQVDSENGTPFPRMNLSVQAIVNCNVGGTCFGGDTSLMF